ncbi:MAG: 16S rRNA (cytidine(1402)-2'-O)-methyltransferase [Spirochaetales bacterium]|nr:16S rRNA (cytidine(1402)-2'-O)-methyltransferase [Spirochaetales bacterium]
MSGDNGCLYIVATPIGNLKDITLRALDTLREVDTIACEDTRHTLKLLNAYSISKRLLSCRSGNEEKAAERIISILREGKNVAYASDAGTPGVSDPGSRLVRMVRDAGFDIVPMPGPSAFAALVSVGAFAGKAVIFEGFLSPKPGKRRKRLKELLERQDAVVIYESPFRIIKLLTDIADLFPDREILIGREMTKIHEEFLEGTANEVLEILNNREKVKGEFSVLVSGKKKS